MKKEKKHIASNGNSILDKNPGKWTNRVAIGTPMTGLVRAEWVFSRYGQTIPTNWSHVDVVQFMSSHIPLEYQVADAENLIAKVVVEQNFEWLFFIESDNVLPNNTFVKMNEYMIDGRIPVVAGLYFTKSDPPEPLIYRGVGNGYYADWKMGDKVWASGIPFGCTLIHGNIIRELWKTSPEYTVGGTVTRRIFESPSESWYDHDKGSWMTNSGTSDLNWCKRVMREGILEKAGFPEFQKSENPYLVDTTIRVKHIDMMGTVYPFSVPDRFLTEEQKKKGFVY